MAARDHPVRVSCRILANRRRGRRSVRGGAATAYYLLRWITLRPWTMGGIGELSWFTSGAPKFILVAAGWIIGMACGGAVLSAVVSRIPPQPVERTRVWLSIWLAICAAPALVSLTEWVPAAVASWATTDWSATADTGPVFAVVGAPSALVAVLLVLGWWVPRMAGVTLPGKFCLIAAIATAALVIPFRVGTDVYFELLRAT